VKYGLGGFSIAREEERRPAMSNGQMPLAPVEQSKSVRERWAWEVTNELAVPREYLCVDEDAIDDHMTADEIEGRPPSPIPGIRFFRRGQVIARVK
jgi:hypothetical protein